MRNKQIIIIAFLISASILLTATKCKNSENDDCHLHIAVQNATDDPLYIYILCELDNSSYNCRYRLSSTDTIPSRGMVLHETGMFSCIEEEIRSSTHESSYRRLFSFYICDTNVPSEHFYYDTAELFSAYNIKKVVNLLDSDVVSLQRSNFTIYYP